MWCILQKNHFLTCVWFSGTVCMYNMQQHNNKTCTTINMLSYCFQTGISNQPKHSTVHMLMTKSFAACIFYIKVMLFHFISGITERRGNFPFQDLPSCISVFSVKFSEHNFLNILFTWNYEVNLLHKRIYVLA